MTVRWRRKRRAVNRALHELRRPLQALALAVGTPDPWRARHPRGIDLAQQVQLARTALADLDRELNGRAERPRPEPVSCRELAERTVERWRERTSAGEVDLFWTAGPAVVRAEPERLAQALDNLIANALEHGTPPVRVGASMAPGRIRISVADRGVRDGANGNGSAGRTERGHGLDVAASAAAAHGGRFFLFPSRTGTVAVLELPTERAGPAIAA